MKNEQDPQLSTLDLNRHQEDDLTYPYALLHALLGLVLLATYSIDASEAARYIGFGFLALSVLHLLRPIRLWKRMKMRRNMRKLARQQAKEAKRAQEITTSGAVSDGQTLVPPAPLLPSEVEAQEQETMITRTSILHKTRKEAPALVR